MADLILTIPNDGPENAAIQHLTAERGETDLGCQYVESLSDRLNGLRSSDLLRHMKHTFHRVRVSDGDERSASNRILSWHNGEIDGRGKVDAAEKNEELMLAQPYLGLPFMIGGKHTEYLRIMRVNIAHMLGVTGSGVRVAIVDSGLDRSAGVTAQDFYDLQRAKPVHRLGAMIDKDGHGTAMAALVASVAPDAEIHVIRVYDKGSLTLWNALAGVGVAAFDCDAAIVSLSFGFDSFLSCGVCGASGSARSVALEKMLDGISQSTASTGHGCIYVAATGNESSTKSFNYPAAYASALAVGSVNGALARSSFSNYGTNHKQYLMAPGGDKNSANVVTEDVGRGSRSSCFGTSVATAYTAGMLALFWSDDQYNRLSRKKFLRAILNDRRGRPKNCNQQEYGAGVIEYRNIQLERKLEGILRKARGSVIAKWANPNVS
jgi:subtilisin family serine protease